MARYTGSSCKLCRREGMKLFLKGDRCLSSKCAVTARGTAPGQHGAAKKKMSEYGTQMREKQKAKRYYGVPEKQFKNYFTIADKKAGMTGENLLTILELRLDNAVYRMGMAESHKEARQLVRHNHFRLNGKKVNIPSIILKTGDVITVSENSRQSDKIKGLIESMQTKLTPKWLEVDKENATAKVIATPARDDVDLPLEEQLIVELYSK